jgi:hypothetical protein
MTSLVTGPPAAMRGKERWDRTRCSGRRRRFGFRGCVRRRGDAGVDEVGGPAACGEPLVHFRDGEGGLVVGGVA